MVQKILVLDDEENYAEMLKTLLEQHRFVVNTVTRAEAALEALQEDGHELVISDFKMPVMDGASFLEKARQVNPDMPFILVSGLMNTPELVRVANMGVTMVLEKPIDVDVFIDTVKQFVKPLTQEEFDNLHKPREVEEEDDEEVLELTYPRDLKYLSGLASNMQRFLQSLWEAVEQGGDVCVSFFPDAELELVIREVSLWKGQPTTSIRMLPAASIGTPAFTEAVQAIAADSEVSNVVGLTGIASLEDDQQATVLKFVSDPQAVCPEANAHTFIYCVEEHLLLNPIPGFSEDLLEVFQENACHLPPFCDKPADLGAYIHHYLELFSRKDGLSEKVQIEPEAVRLLLSYSWPHNFREMITVLRRVVRLGRKGPLTAQEVANILKRSGVSKIPEATEDWQLQQILVEKQRLFIKEMMEDKKMLLPNLLEEIGVDAAAVNGTGSVEDLDLLFPELLQGNAQQ